MSNSLFDEGGPYNTRRVGADKYEMHIDIPPDEHGLVGRQCPDETCSPGYFKIKLGTGITGAQDHAYCPYCRHEDEPSGFVSQGQKDYLLKVLGGEAIKAVHNAISQGLGLGPSGKKKYGSGMVSMELSYKASPPRPISRPLEEELRRDITCPSCSLEHAVFGLATWCPDCGTDIFLTHVDAELNVVRKILSAVESRRSELGARVAARDIENALEDVVSVYEAVLKVITKRQLLKQGLTTNEVADRIKKLIRNSYQNIKSAGKTFQAQVGQNLYEGVNDDELDYLDGIFGKRHPITHNLGVIDRSYLEKALSKEKEGREVMVSKDEVARALELSLSVLQRAYNRVSPT